MRRMKLTERRWEYESVVLCYLHVKKIWEHTLREAWREVDTADLIRYKTVIGTSMPCDFCDDGGDCDCWLGRK